MHAAAFKQATGEAHYCDDIPKMEGELYLGLVISNRAHAKIKKVDPSEALLVEGVEAFLTAEDLPPNRNLRGPIQQDEEIFRSDTVTSVGQVIGAVVAQSQKIAQEASRKVLVEYEDLQPLILTIEEAIAAESYLLPVPIELSSGDVIKGLAESDHIVQGEFRMGGQNHFYMETQTTLCVPQDGDELKVFGSFQHPAGCQHVISNILGIAENKIQVSTKRLGGGFGGKESNAYITAPICALASVRLQRPVRSMLDRDEDMQMAGGRHPFYFQYKVGFTKEGVLKALEVKAYANAGYSMDVSPAVLGEAIYKLGNYLRIPNTQLKGWLCKTNLPSNTAFRGFGGPQGMMVSELIVREVSRVAKKSYFEILELNMARKGDKTYFGQEFEDDNMERCLKDLLKRTQFEQRVKGVNEFNAVNRWKKRGISVINTVYPIGFGGPQMFMNQGAVLVNIYTDGSVLIESGGVEMGQGLHVKLIQVAATVLDIPVDDIHISSSNTASVPNAIVTAGSMGTDLFGGAVQIACEKLKKRLAPLKEAHPEKSFKDLVSMAFFGMISLSATGFYKRQMKDRYGYLVYGSSCSEVEIDCLTGDHQVMRTDIVMDLGSSLNPAIDIGQIEGGYMQGYGLFTMEEMVYSSSGQVLSKGPGMYKIPSASNIPGEFNVSLLENSSNPRAVFSSKAIGEPPLFCASSVYFAIKEAIGAARASEGLEEHFDLTSPATAERIRMACKDKISMKVRKWDSY